MKKDQYQNPQYEDKFPPILFDRGKFISQNTLFFIPEIESAILNY